MTEREEEKLQKWPAALIRKTFLDYFSKKRGHTVWPSSPVVPLK
jgi:alanyl-tRNA synthetase